MADLGRRARGRGDRRQADREARAPVESLKIGPYTAGDDVDYGPLVTARRRSGCWGSSTRASSEGAKLVVDGRDFSLQGYEDGYFVGPLPVRPRDPDMDIYRRRSSAPSCRPCAPTPTRRRWPRHGPRIRQRHAIFTRDGDTARDFAHRVNVGMVGSTCRSRCRWPTTPSAAGRNRLRRPEPARAGRLPLLHPDQDRHGPLALRREGGCRLLDPHDGIGHSGAPEARKMGPHAVAACGPEAGPRRTPRETVILPGDAGGNALVS